MKGRHLVAVLSPTTTTSSDPSSSTNATPPLLRDIGLLDVDHSWLLDSIQVVRHVVMMLEAFGCHERRAGAWSRRVFSTGQRFSPAFNIITRTLLEQASIVEVCWSLSFT